MTGLVVVSHLAALSEAAATLARALAGEGVPIATAGGTGRGDGIGTDAARIAAAIRDVGAVADEVVMVLDLGGAVQSAEAAISGLDPALAARVHLCPAPLVEGVAAAAVTAAGGAAAAAVVAEALAALDAKRALLGAPAQGAPLQAAVTEGGMVDEFDVTCAGGLHARPAAGVVRTAAAFDAQMSVTNATTGAGPARATSLTALATLGALRGHRLRVEATGPQAAEALVALRRLAEDNFGDPDDGAGTSPASARGGPAGVTAPPAPGGAGGPPAPPFQLAPDGSFLGQAAAPGAVVGPARRLRRPPPAPRTPGAPQEERRALHDALERARAEVRFARDAIAHQVGEDHARMMDAHTALLDDDALIGPAEEAIGTGVRAETAWVGSLDAAIARFAALADPLMRARAEDVRDIGRRVLAQFAGGASGPPTLRGPGIVIARDLGAGEVAALDRALVHGIAVATGSPTSHTAILARALDIPCVVGIGEGLMSIGEETPILVDGDAGTLRIAPDPETVARVRAERAAREERRAALERAAAEPAATADGTRIEVVANIAHPDEAADAAARGADGVGLFRSEFLFTARDDLPGEDEQESAYRRAAEGLAGRRLVIRTVDAGGDKPIPALAPPEEANPFLGVRGVRLSLRRPDVLRTQLRALLRVAADHPVGVMFPMIATLDELRAARAVLGEARASLATEGLAAGDVEVGVMIEVPAAALCADALAPEADFFSIGTNDLTQYVLAAERGNGALTALSDPMHPAVLRLIGIVGRAASAGGTRVAVCGELAADPAATAILIGLGVGELSVAPPAIGEVKALVRAQIIDDARDRASAALMCASADEVRAAATGCRGDCEGCANHCHD